MCKGARAEWNAVFGLHLDACVADVALLVWLLYVCLQALAVWDCVRSLDAHTAARRKRSGGAKEATRAKQAGVSDGVVPVKWEHVVCFFEFQAGNMNTLKGALTPDGRHFVVGDNMCGVSIFAVADVDEAVRARSSRALPDNPGQDAFRWFTCQRELEPQDPQLAAGMPSGPDEGLNGIRQVAFSPWGDATMVTACDMNIVAVWKNKSQQASG